MLGLMDELVLSYCTYLMDELVLLQYEYSYADSDVPEDKTGVYSRYLTSTVVSY